MLNILQMPKKIIKQLNFFYAQFNFIYCLIFVWDDIGILLYTGAVALLLHWWRCGAYDVCKRWLNKTAEEEALQLFIIRVFDSVW